MFKLRNVAGVALVLGIAAGVWLSDFWKGFGGGNGIGLGKGGNAVSISSGDGESVPVAVENSPSTVHAGHTVRIVIRDRSYFLRTGQEETPVSLEQILDAVRSAPGDDDGVKLRVYRAESSRPTAELQLQETLQKADVPESATYWSPDAMP
jgi:hypothetical protein